MIEFDVATVILKNLSKNHILLLAKSLLLKINIMRVLKLWLLISLIASVQISNMLIQARVERSQGHLFVINESDINIEN